MSNQQQATYDVDLVLCIDTTGSMVPVIDDVKANALTFHESLEKKLSEKGKVCDNLRVKVIDYRDYYDNSSDALNESVFFNLPDDKTNFDSFVNSLTAGGGGDEPESGLEAFYVAMQSDWKRDNSKRRELIVIWTDASAHSLESSHSKPSNYPQGIPSTFGELTDLWLDEQDEQQAKPNSARRLIMFAPDASPWNDIATHWKQVIHMPTSAGQGMNDVEFDSILDAIANSV